MTETRYILSIDPGGGTGVSLGTYTDCTPYTVLNVWHVPGGLTGLQHWLSYEARYSFGINVMEFKLRADQHPTDYLLFDPDSPDQYTVICERFVPLSGGGFSHTSDSIEPLRIEGALRMASIMPNDYDNPRWQRPQSMVLHKVGSTAENKKAGDNVLRAMGLWHTPKQVGASTAKDINASLKHAVAYLKKTKHRPTLDAIERAVK